MRSPRTFQAGIALLLMLAVALQPVRALVSIDDGRNQIFINSALTIGYDSNLFAQNGGGGDTSYALSLGADYVRRAGWIGLNAGVSVNATRYGKFTNEDFNNPTFTAELTKQTGRTTGSLTLSAARQSRSDTAANLRDESWIYDAGLNFKYPVIERYSLAGSLGYSFRDFADNTTLVDLKTYSAGVDLFYVFTTDRDLLAGYHFREEDTSAHNKNFDHSFSVGMTGKLFGRLNGSVRGGFTHRVPQGSPDGSFDAFTGSASVTWSFSKRLILSGAVSKDFSTTSTNVSVDTLNTSVNAQYAFSSKTNFSSGMGWSNTDFLGRAGGNRHDTNWSWNVAANHTFNGHLSASLSYTYSQNWSTLALSDFGRTGLSFSLSSRF